jgi:hypothetical protein
MSVVRFLREDLDGSSEVLTVVRLDEDADLAIEVCAGPNVGDDFVGIYDLDGEQIPFPGAGSWSVVDGAELTEQEIADIEEGWATGTTTVTRLA